MSDFEFDTSGEVRGRRLVEQPDGAWRSHWAWSDLSPFVQGYVEALFADGPFLAVNRDSGEEYLSAGFSDLAPETLARIVEDCAKHPNAQPHKHPGDPERQRRAGRYAWEDAAPRPAISLGDDGKVYLS